VLGSLYVTCGIALPEFFGASMARNLLVGNAVLGFVAVGMTFVLLSGGIDLSVGAAIGFSSVLVASLVGEGWPPAVAMGAAVSLGAGAGAGMGGLIHRFALPPFLVTLAGMLAFRGLALRVEEASIPIRHPLYATLAERGAAPLPPVALLFLATLLAAWVVLRWLPFGRDVLALGGSEESARLMGRPVARTKVLVYAISGACAGLAGVASTMALGAGNAGAGHFYELDAIAAVVVGGTRLEGGAGSVMGTLTGLLLFGLLQELLPFLGIENSWWFRIAMGGLLLAFVLLQRALEDKAARRLPIP
jgi:simple sugar transport system permease protein